MFLKLPKIIPLKVLFEKTHEELHCLLFIIPYLIHFRPMFQFLSKHPNIIIFYLHASMKKRLKKPFKCFSLANSLSGGYNSYMSHARDYWEVIK